MVAKIWNILIGWGRALKILITPVNIQELSKKRLEVCGGCEAAKESKALEFINGSAEYIKVIYCTECKCPCSQKSLVKKETCPLGKWDFK